MMKHGEFEIQILGYPLTLADWSNALAVPKTELPALSEEQKKDARGYGESLEEYARRQLAGRYAEERVKLRAGQFSEEVSKILKRVAPDSSLAGIVVDMAKDRWILTIQRPKGGINIAVPRELADEVVDWGFRERVEDLKEKLLYGLGLDEELAKPRH